MKKLLVVCVALIAGCTGVSKEDFNAWAKKHDNALASAVQHMDNADKGLESIVNPPPQVPVARTEIAAAKTDVGVAQTVSKQIVAAAGVVVEKNEKLNNQIIGPKGQAILAGVGVIVALIGVSIVLLRFGGIGGKIAAIPFLGAALMSIKVLPKAKPVV